MKIVLATDAWVPQINGVVTTLLNVTQIMKERGHEVHVLHPGKFKVLPFRLYPDVDFVWNTWAVGSAIKKLDPDAVHIATEGPIGVAARLHCEEHKLNYSSSFHTKFAEYIKSILPFIPLSWPYGYLRWLHNKAGCILVTNQQMKQELTSWGFNQDKMRVWTRGADITLFHPNKYDRFIYQGLKRPILFYLGRVSREKNIEAFCELKAPGTKVIIGDGPIRKQLEKQYPEIVFVGMKHGDELARYIASGDVFVFPSLWDTFGVVMIEANACGVPIASFPATGPNEYILDMINGYIDPDLDYAVTRALETSRETCREHVEQNYTWDRCADIFYQALQPVRI